MSPSPKNKILVASMLLIACVGAYGVYVQVQKEKKPLTHALYKDPKQSTETRALDLLSHMTLREKIGQMTLVEKNSIHTPGKVSQFALGAMLSGGGAGPRVNTDHDWREMIETFVSASRESRTGIPLLYGVDANHGQGNVKGAVVFPHFIGLGATGSEMLVEKIGAATAQQSRAVGSTWIYSPTLDLPRDIRWGRVYEAFSDDPVVVGTLAAAYVRGLQGQNGISGILSSAKHYVGLGSMLWNSSSSDTDTYKIDQGATPANEKQLREEYLPPFKKVVDAGVGSIMVGLNSWGPTKLSASTYLISDVLKGELGFKGFVVSDWYGVYEISPTDDKYYSTVTAINAGIDMVMLPYDYEEFISDVEKAVKRGDISEDRINDATLRILRQKFQIGLFDSKNSSGIASINNAEQQSLAREAVAKSMVLLKNEHNVLPLSHDLRKIRIAGSAANNLGQQMGGWTINWQGFNGNDDAFGTTIAQAIEREVGSSTLVQIASNGIFSEKDVSDVGIAIVGEKPYAEGWGDTSDPRISDEDLAAIEHLRASSKKIIVIIVSGRPLILTKHIEGWDALVAAWLPGSAGEGVSDVLFGEVPFSGKLPLPWPASLSQLPIDGNKTADGTAPLFARYSGLSTK